MENGSAANLTNEGLYPLDIMGGGLTVNDGSLTVKGPDAYDRGILLANCGMTVNEGGRVTVVKGGIRGLTNLGSAPSVTLVDGATFAPLCPAWNK